MSTPATPATTTSPNQRLVLVAMIFSVAMMFIDQTIVALAIPSLQVDLSLSATGAQWIVNGYLLALAALFLLGGKLSDVLGHRRMLTIGVSGFAVCSALCGATPDGSIGETWIIVARVFQGGFAALLFPAAVAIVVSTFPVNERGKAMATFFGITGGLSALGPLLGGFLTEWTWRAIFWVNLPVAVIALVLVAKSKPAQARTPGTIDYRGAVLGAAAMGLIVLGLQQSAVWGFADVRTIGAIVIGLLLLAAFVLGELRQRSPLTDLRIFAGRAFASDNLVLGLMSAVFIPFFFFASVYAQASLGYSATQAGTLLLVFYGGFAIAAQFGGRILDKRGAKPSVMLGCAVAAVGFYLWGREVTTLDFDRQWHYLALAGAGLGLVLGPVSTDALNRAANTSYGEVTGLTQTVRNLGASLGLAVLGSLFVHQNVDRVETTLTGKGVPAGTADRIAHSVTSAGTHSAPSGPAGRAITDAVHLDIAHSTQIVVWVMAGIMVAALVVAIVGMPKAQPAQDEPAPAEGELATA